MVNVSIECVIPNYNGLTLLKKYLPTVVSVFSDYPGSRITIVDDASLDGSATFLRSFIESHTGRVTVRMLRNEKNLGFSSTVNRAALEASADILVFLNTDVVPEKKFLDPVLKDFKNDQTLFGIGFLDKSIEGNRTVLRGRGTGRWTRGLLVHDRGEIDENTTLWISGGSCAVRAELFKKLGGFDRLFDPFYWEDIDISYRAKKRGYGLLFEKESPVTHYHEKGAIKNTYTGFKVAAFTYRNQFLFIWKNITDFNLIMSHFFWLPYHFLKHALTLDTPFFYGFLLATLSVPAIIMRRKNQNIRRGLSDKQILAELNKQ